MKKGVGPTFDSVVDAEGVGGIAPPSDAWELSYVVELNRVSDSGSAEEMKEGIADVEPGGDGSEAAVEDAIGVFACGGAGELERAHAGEDAVVSNHGDGVNDVIGQLGELLDHHRFIPATCVLPCFAAGTACIGKGGVFGAFEKGRKEGTSIGGWRESHGNQAPG